MDDNNYFVEDNETVLGTNNLFDESLKEDTLETELFVTDNQPYREEIRIMKKYIEVKRMKKSDNGE